MDLITTIAEQEISTLDICHHWDGLWKYKSSIGIEGTGTASISPFLM